MKNKNVFYGSLATLAGLILTLNIYILYKISKDENVTPQLEIYTSRNKLEFAKFNISNLDTRKAELFKNSFSQLLFTGIKNKCENDSVTITFQGIEIKNKKKLEKQLKKIFKAKPQEIPETINGITKYRLKNLDSIPSAFALNIQVGELETDLSSIVTITACKEQSIHCLLYTSPSPRD